MVIFVCFCTTVIDFKLSIIQSAMETAQRAIPNLDVPKMDMRNASYVQM